MGLIDDLHEAQENATGAAAAALASLISLPVATLWGVAEAVQGRSFNDASTDVMHKFASVGMFIGKGASDEIVKELLRVHSKPR